MVRDLIEKEVAAAKHAVDAVRNWIHPTTAMKRHEFDSPLDDLGQTLDEQDRPEPPEPPKGAPST
jgi:hypothetical protein